MVDIGVHGKIKMYLAVVKNPAMGNPRIHECGNTCNARLER
jgi:hypothetical protein